MSLWSGATHPKLKKTTSKRRGKTLAREGRTASPYTTEDESKDSDMLDISKDFRTMGPIPTFPKQKEFSSRKRAEHISSLPTPLF